MEQIISFFTDTDSSQLLVLFVKAFAVLFSVLYLVYAVIITRQSQEMNKTFSSPMGPFIFFMSFVQIVFAIILIYVSIVLL
jgi:hypothetical protein